MPAPGERLAVISKFKAAGIACGMFLMPVIPFISDQPKIMEETIKKGKEAGVDFIVMGTMTLKARRQKDHFNA